MTTYQLADGITLHHDDCLARLRSDELGYDRRLGYAPPLIPDDSVDAVVTDPPYGLSNTDPARVADTITRWVTGDRDYLPGGTGFMGNAWDAFVPPVAVWDECLRVLKPGGHVVAFAGSRTHDLMTLALRLAGFEIREALAWMYGQGFPKGRNISADIDRRAGAERPVISSRTHGPAGSAAADQPGGRTYRHGATRTTTGPATDDAAAWEGWSTALKPAYEPIVLARKPFPGPVADNVLEHGTGALNIGACRIGYAPDDPTVAWGARYGGRPGFTAGTFGTMGAVQGTVHSDGRWPPNVILDDTTAAVLDEQSGEQRDGVAVNRNRTGDRKPSAVPIAPTNVANRDDVTYGGGGGASRFFYVAKASSAERITLGGTAHTTVKPLDVMRWLVRLITRPGGTVLEPFAGSGTTVEACILEGMGCVAIERETTYLPLIRQRVDRRLHPVAAAAAAAGPDDPDDLFSLLTPEETP